VLAAVDGPNQLHDYLGEAEEQLESLSHDVPARTLVALLCHCGAFPACSPGDPPPGWCRAGDPARARISVPAGVQGHLDGIVTSPFPKVKCTSVSTFTTAPTSDRYQNVTFTAGGQTAFYGDAFEWALS
jgi:hypothetical protein